MRIRAARLDDQEAITACYQESWEGAFRSFAPEIPVEALRARGAHAARRMRASDALGLVVEHEGEIVGMLLASACTDEDVDPACVAEISMVYLNPSAQGHGIGRALVRRALADLTPEYERVVLWVDAGNEPAQRCYRACGLVADGSWQRRVLTAADAWQHERIRADDARTPDPRVAHLLRFVIRVHAPAS